jgi:PAS domain S-box-containing protein
LNKQVEEGPRRDFGTEHLVRGVFVLILIALAVTAVVAFSSIRSAESSGWWVEHTLDVEKELGTLASSVGGSRAAYLEFVITGQSESVGRLEAARGVVTRQVQRLQELTLDNPSQQQRILALGRAVEEDSTFASAVVARRQQSGWEAARSLLTAGGPRGPPSLSAVRSLVDEMTNEEDRLLRERTSRSAVDTRRATTLGAALGAFALFAMGAGYALVRNDARSRRAAFGAIQESEGSLATTLDSIGDAVIATDTDGRIVRMNPVAENLTGWMATDALGKPLSEVFRIINETTRTTSENPVDRVLREGVVVALANHTALVRRDGTERPISDSAAPIRDARGGLRGVVLVFRDTTDEREALLAVKRGQERLTALYEAGIIGIVVSTLDGRLREINDALLDSIGYSREEILSESFEWTSLTPPEWRDVDRRALDELQTTGRAALREKEYVRKDGSRVPVMVGSTALAGPDGEAISFVLDLTSNRRAALAVEHLREVRASETMFRGLLEAAPDAVVIVESDGQIARVNGQAEQLFGYPRHELVGQGVEMLMPERFRSNHLPLRTGYFGSAQARLMGSGLELFGRRKDDSEFPIEISLSPLESAAGRLVSAAIRDISARKKADEQRFRLAAMVDSSDDAIIGKTFEGIVTSWNGGAQRLFGYSAAEMIGQSISLLIPAGREYEEPEILKHLASGLVERFDTVRRRKDGREIDVSVTSSPVRDAAGALIGASKVVRDITERRRTEVSLAQAKEAAEAANRELEAFSYSVAHDLRAPLRGMNGFARVLLDTYSDKLDAEGQDWLQEILLNARKMADLIDGLLSLARVTRSDLRTESADLSAIVREAVGRLNTAEPDRLVEVIVPDGLCAEVDLRLARSLFENLLANAWKFTSKVPSARIELGATDRDGARVFFVRDNGAGFDMAFAGKLFAPFHRLHTVDEFPGTGIGLATVQRIVHRHKGRVWAEGAVDGGATFYFTLPSPALGVVT